MGFWDAISNALKNTADKLETAEQEASNEAEYLSDAALERKIMDNGSGLAGLKKRSVYIRELDSRTAAEAAKLRTTRQLEEKIRNCGDSFIELRKKSIYMNELENRKSK